MAAYRQRILEFDELLAERHIDRSRLDRLCFTGGIPDDPRIRALSWKILLNYLPHDRDCWTKYLKKQRDSYKNLLREMIMVPGAKQYENSRTDVTFEDHPLNPHPTSQWSQYFKDNEVLLQIDKDVRRLLPDIGFFQRATKFPCVELHSEEKSQGFETLRKRVEQTVLNAQNVSKNRLGITNMVSPKKVAVEEYGTLPAGQEAHWEVVERILFIYAKLNPGQSYVQGMNEIIGPIYYLFASNPDTLWQEHAEADSFFCFTNLMSEIRDNFIKSLDDSAHGISALMASLMDLLRRRDAVLWQRFHDQDLKPQFFAFRWLTLLLSQEFPLPEVLRLWDTLFADQNRFQFLISVNCAMIVHVRDNLMTGDFSANMKLLQNFPSTDMARLLQKAAVIHG